ncbi:helix-turn-helix domain-containing protein [Rathayibacter sp. VKM Ac-2804]|uniref:helix-turn-helix domain-containing protein n=1 Tax=unclassified Rathayibacter TaxID=2609250 RepID=UPI00132F229C|nr:MULTISPECIES: helix-turn-helix transcriptional regulator [unclassified Rathayibacter]NRG42510.1 helix-turn-helix domain-containing protein [Rathayibacter sp. VKM Ac-2835]QHF24436.1 helix-turn-helix domain-containing protein [Rathayibacter sp. VKM Ac-2804]
MDTAHEDIAGFLASRRARLTPAEAGLPDVGGRRRVAGLRREEVAALAGVSPGYYRRLERGQALGVSESVLGGLARALRLNETERAHLDDLVRAANAAVQPRRERPARPGDGLSPGAQQMIAAMSTVPVFVQNRRLDAVAANALGRALFAPMLAAGEDPANAARFVFLDARARSFYRDWQGTAEQLVAVLRREAGRSPRDQELAALLERLASASPVFRALWSSHDVREHRTGTKDVHHPVVGDLSLSFETLELASQPGLQVLVFSAEPGSASADGLQLLANLTLRRQGDAAATSPTPAAPPTGRTL